jgi:hypothetical protein
MERLSHLMLASLFLHPSLPPDRDHTQRRPTPTRLLFLFLFLFLFFFFFFFFFLLLPSSLSSSLWPSDDAGSHFHANALVGLRVLRLHNNRLKTVQETTLEALRDLTWLELHSNDLASLPSSISLLSGSWHNKEQSTLILESPQNIKTATRYKSLTIRMTK